MKALGKTLAFLIVLGLVAAGSATAAKMITGKEIADRTVKGVDIAKHTLKTSHLTDGAQAELTGPAGPQGPAGPAGPAGPEGPAGPAGQEGGPNRYAEVGSTGVLQEDVKNIDQTQVDHPDVGRYCFTFPAGDRPTSGAATGLNSDTIATLEIEAAGGIDGCPAAANVMVRTWDATIGDYQNNSFRLILSSN